MWCRPIAASLRDVATPGIFRPCIHTSPDASQARPQKRNSLWSEVAPRYWRRNDSLILYVEEEKTRGDKATSI
jgi:hypothetical protein